MADYNKFFDFNKDGKLDFFEKAMYYNEFERMNQEYKEPNPKKKRLYDDDEFDLEDLNEEYDYYEDDFDEEW